MTEGMVKVCACGCNRPSEEVYESMSWNSGYLNPEQARERLKPKMVPASEVHHG